ncbi:MAG: hypothetical protein EPO09_13580 [Aquabacterium sp.]|uniref:hypothetical protein n=1 Tax=Aquabacterium sp. TaxID=1872578 RepID=UPI001200ACBA|nr:hypothetical protein [Aquabacterium sp.]TAK93143.1 MAG: hypothetical protein EPO09_13580 [Aquabacterium sp.]
MFEAYKVAVKIEIINGVTPALSLIAKELMKADGNVRDVNNGLKTMHERMSSLQKLGMAGGMLAGFGAAGLAMFKGPIDAAREYELTFTKFKALNLGDAVNRQADQFARSANVMGVSAKQLMTTMSESVGLFGSFDLARQVAPMLSQLNMANAAIFKGKVGEIDEGGTRGLLHFIDRRGGTHDIASFKRNLDLAEKLVTGSGGFVQFRDLDQFSQQGGTAFRGLSDEGVLNMALLLQEQGGARAGTSFMSLYQNLIGGRTPKKTMALLQEYGLGHIAMQEHATVGGKSLKSMVMTDITGRDLLQSNPTAWMRTVFLPALAAHGVTSEGDILKATNDLLSNRTASNQGSIMSTQLLQIARDAKLAKNAMGYDAVIKAYGDDPNSKFGELQARWTDAMRELGLTILPAAIKGVEALTAVLKAVSNTAQEFPTLTTAITGTGLALTGLAAAGGSLALFKAGLGGLGMEFGAAGQATGLIGRLGLAASGAGGLALALGGGLVFGSLIYSMIEGTKTADKMGETMARIFAFFGSKEAKEALAINGVPGYQSGGATGSWGSSGATGSWGDSGIETVKPQSKEIHVHTHHHMDGRKVAEVVTKHQAKEMSGPAAGGRHFDPSMMPMSILIGR